MAKSLSDKIAGILNAAPVSFDPEDDIHEETVARVVSKTVSESSDEEIIGKFRKQNVELLEEVDNRYKGKRATRKKLGGDGWSTGEEGNSSPEGSDLENTEDEEDTQTHEDDNSDDLREEQDSTDENSEVDSVVSSDNDKNEQNDFTHIEEPNASAQIQKGDSVRQQLSMWENLLEMRIQFQKCLIAANKLPELSKFEQTKVTETKKGLTDLLDKMLYLQLLLIRKYPETKTLLSGSNQVVDSKTDEDDEEIPSDTEDEQQDDLDEEVIPKKKRKLNYASELEKRHSLYKKYRESVIQKWNDKTRIATNKSGSSFHSVLKQIEHILSDKEKLIKRTQLCRIDYGNTDNRNHEQGDINGSDVYCTEIFDDTDFYHQLLRELIEYKSADLTDPVQLGRQWIQLQNLRSKMKRKIDTRATKGRKIRYAVHSKLVNFMAPVEGITWQNEAKNELYNSLFGKGQPVNKV